MTNLEFDDLRPFQSAVFAYHSSGSTPSVRRVIVELRKLLKVKTSGSRRQRSLQIYEDEAGDDGWGILQYSHRQPASWVLPGVEGADHDDRGLTTPGIDESAPLPSDRRNAASAA